MHIKTIDPQKNENTHTHISVYIFYISMHSIYFICIKTLLRLDLRDSLRADALAMQQIKNFGGGKLVMYAWMSRGMVTPEDMASWHCNGDMKLLADMMSQTKETLTKFAQLNSLETMDFSKEAERVRKAAQGALQGETSSGWALVDMTGSSSEPVLLPNWFKTPISRSLLLWQKECEEWQKKHIKRWNDGHKELTPGMQKKFQEWQEHHTRRLVLDKSRESQVMNLKNKDLNQLKSSCLLIEIKMSEDPDDLRIRSGNGKYFKLVLLEGVEPILEIPKQLDVLAGQKFLLLVFTSLLNNILTARKTQFQKQILLRQQNQEMRWTTYMMTRTVVQMMNQIRNLKTLTFLMEIAMPKRILTMAGTSFNLMMRWMNCHQNMRLRVRMVLLQRQEKDLSTKSSMPRA